MKSQIDSAFGLDANIIKSENIIVINVVVFAYRQFKLTFQNLAAGHGHHIHREHSRKQGQGHPRLC